jgi:predicted O-methyltransferase YrrM
MADGITEVPRALKRGIMLGIVSGRGVSPLEMVPAIVMQSWPSNTNLLIRPVYGANTDQGRILVAKEAVTARCKYLWLVDDDTVPPVDTGRQLAYLLEQNGPPNGKVMVAAGVYCTRSSPPEPLIFTSQGSGPDWNWKVGEILKRWGAGTGCMMINTDLFEHLPEPWFLTTMQVDKKESDDLYFCAKVADAGYELLVHGGILCHHYDLASGIAYTLPRQSRPYKERICEPREPASPVAVMAPKSPFNIEKAEMISGWMTTDELMWLAEHASRAKSIAEVGSWMGRSTRAMADNTKAKVYAIDTWKGSEEHQEMLQDRPAKWLRLQFEKNMEGTSIEPMEMTSLEAAEQFVKQGKKFDMVFIDADHEYAEIRKDIIAWKSLVKPGGILCGHDYSWPSVIRAVDELIPERKVVDRYSNSIWYLHVGRRAKLAKSLVSARHG